MLHFFDEDSQLIDSMSPQPSHPGSLIVIAIARIVSWSINFPLVGHAETKKNSRGCTFSEQHVNERHPCLTLAYSPVS